MSSSGWRNLLLPSANPSTLVKSSGRGEGMRRSLTWHRRGTCHPKAPHHRFLLVTEVQFPGYHLHHSHITSHNQYFNCQNRCIILLNHSCVRKALVSPHIQNVVLHWHNMAVHFLVSSFNTKAICNATFRLTKAKTSLKCKHCETASIFHVEEMLGLILFSMMGCKIVQKMVCFPGT
jgi:hypothetical protein